MGPDPLVPRAGGRRPEGERHPGRDPRSRSRNGYRRHHGPVPTTRPSAPSRSADGRLRSRDRLGPSGRLRSRDRLAGHPVVRRPTAAGRDRRPGTRRPGRRAIPLLGPRPAGRPDRGGRGGPVRRQADHPRTPWTDRPVLPRCSGQTFSATDRRATAPPPRTPSRPRRSMPHSVLARRLRNRVPGRDPNPACGTVFSEGALNCRRDLRRLRHPVRRRAVRRCPPAGSAAARHRHRRLRNDPSRSIGCRPGPCREPVPRIPTDGTGDPSPSRQTPELSNPEYTTGEVITLTSA
jgi:hypothetical protein